MLDGIVAERIGRNRVRLRALPAARVDSQTEAFTRLMHAELDRAYRLAAVILSDASEAEDAVHDAALAAWRAWNTLRDEERAAAWFQRIVINACRDRLRRRRRRSILEVIRAPHESVNPMATDPAESAELRDLLRAALRDLSADERLAVTLRYAADMTVPAIADSLAVAEGTVKSRLHNALRKLRLALEGNAVD